MTEITIVPDESLACPGCGAYWGNPNKDLDYPNRFKVDSFCRCYNPKCEIAYYDPYSGITEKESDQCDDCYWFGNVHNEKVEH